MLLLGWGRALTASELEEGWHGSCPVEHIGPTENTIHICVLGVSVAGLGQEQEQQAGSPETSFLISCFAAESLYNA